MKYKFKKIFSLILLIFIFLFTIGFSNNNVKVIASSDYYSNIDSSLYGTNLKKALRNLITTTHTYETTYDDCKNPKYVKKTDGDPNNSNNIILFWSNLSVSSAWDGATTWNREHVWPKSQAWYETSGGGSDLHHIRPTDPRVNTVHNNHPYGIVSSGEYVQTSPANGSKTTEAKYKNSLFEPGDSRKGDTARIIFYLLTRYSQADSYTITNVATSMNMLLEWNNADPVDASEIRRNDAVQEIQGNRNPFIDNSNYANLIWGNATPQTNYYDVNVKYDSSKCNVTISGNKNSSNKYTGNVTITISPLGNNTYSGLKDLSSNSILTTSTTYTISNISKNYNLEVLFNNESGGGTITPTPPVTGNTYKLVKNISELNVGDNIIIVSNDKDYALSTEQRTNNRGQIEITKENETISKIDGIQNITLEEGTKSNTFAFNTGNGYLYAASSSANQLKTKSDKDENSSWSIEINDSGIANIVSQGSNSRNQLKYNSGASIFSCYGQGNTQKEVSIYKLESSSIITPSVDYLKLFQQQTTKNSLIVRYNKTTSDTVDSDYEYTFESKQFNADNQIYDLGGIEWTVHHNGGHLGYDSTKGQQIGSKSNPASSLTLTSESLNNIKSIEINTCGASSIAATLKVSVGGTQYGNDKSLTTTPTTYIFDNINASGAVEFNYNQTSSKALYIKSIKITYASSQDTYTLSSASLRFGTTITKEMYDDLSSKGAIWGVEYCYSNVTDWSDSTIVKYTATGTPARVNRENATEVDENGNYYQYALVLNNLKYNDLDNIMSARMYVEIEGVKYYMNSASMSVRQLCNIYLNNENKEGYINHLGILEHLKGYNNEK